MGEKAASASDLPESPSARKRKAIGWSLTVGWFAACGAIAWGTWVPGISFHDLMESVAAAFGPIALLWLILGYQQQGEELALQRQELELQRQETARLADEASKQARAVTDNELHARRDVFFRQLELTKAEIVRLVVLIIRGVDGKIADGTRYDLEIESLVARYNSGERDIFLDVLIYVCVGGKLSWFKAALNRVFGDYRTIKKVFTLAESVLEEAANVDPSGKLLAFLKTSIVGEVYFILGEEFSFEQKYRRE